VNGGGTSADYMINIASQSYQININSGGSDVSIGIINQNIGVNANFNAVYTTQTSVNILVIVLGVLGGLLIIALIVAACFIIKRIRNPAQAIHPNSSAIIHRQSAQQDMLSA
jgi:hypothetical protein